MIVLHHCPSLCCFFFLFVSDSRPRPSGQLGARGGEGDGPPTEGGDPSPFLPRSVDSGAGRPNWKEPACLLRPGRAGQKGGGPAGPFGSDPAGQKGGDQLAKLLGKIGPKKVVPNLPDPPASPPLGTVTFTENPLLKPKIWLKVGANF